MRSVDDSRALHNELTKLGNAELGVVLKIETRAAFENLASLLLEGLKRPALGVMIARAISRSKSASGASRSCRTRSSDCVKPRMYPPFGQRKCSIRWLVVASSHASGRVVRVRHPPLAIPRCRERLVAVRGRQNDHPIRPELRTIEIAILIRKDASCACVIWNVRVEGFGFRGMEQLSRSF